METQITVIVPFYNAEKYVDRCLTSLLNQTYSDFKIILVNDGSIDQTGELCQAYANRDDRIAYIEQENGGEGAARNAGLKILSTPYVLFVDCDDELPADIIELYMGMRGKADLIVGGIRIYGKHGIKNCIPKNRQIDVKKDIAHILIQDKFWVNPPWNKLYKTQIIQKYGITFNDFKFGGDTDFVYSYLAYAKTVRFINQAVYCVHRVEGSMSRRKVPEVWSYMRALFEKGRNFAPNDAWFVYMLLLWAIKTSLLLKTRESRQNFIETCQQIYLYVEQNDIDRTVQGGFPNKLVLKLLSGKKYSLLFWITKVRSAIGSMSRS